MFHPSRGGVRGGKDQFKWDDVKTDKVYLNQNFIQLKQYTNRNKLTRTENATWVIH